MDYATMMRAALQAPRPASRAMQASVMNRPSEAPPEINADLPLESVSPEDWIPNPKTLLAAGAKGLGAVGSIAGQQELIKLLRKGALPGNSAIRYEVAGRPLFDKGVVHYDASGGKQAFDILKLPKMTEEGDYLSKPDWRKANLDAQFKIGDISQIHPDIATYKPSDPWMYARFRSNLLKPWEHQFYVNDAEGAPINLTGMPTPNIKDILNDPELRQAYNLSLAVPENSKFHQTARILRRE